MESPPASSSSYSQKDRTPGWLTAVVILLCVAIGIVVFLFAFRILDIPLSVEHMSQQELELASIKEYTVDLLPDDMQTLTLGQTIQLTYTLSPEGLDAGPADWISDNQSVVTVDGNGLVTAVGPGSASVRVSFPRYSTSDGVSFTVNG